MSAAGAARGVHAFAVALALAWLLWWPGAAVAQPTRSVLTGYKLVSWPMENGAPSRINSITQSSDGYLWIGGVDGLTRFDGVRFEQIRWNRPGGERMVVSDVLGARSGDVWVGLARSGGVYVYRNGRLWDAHMPNPSREVTDVAQDRDGAIWVARGGRATNTVARYSHGRWEEIGAASGLPAQPVWQFLFGRDGTMWVLLSNAVVRKPPGSDRFLLTGAHVASGASIVEDRAGRIWISDVEGVRLLETGATALVSPDPAAERNVPRPGQGGGTKLLSDRYGRLWATTLTDGIVRLGVPGEASRPGPAGARQEVQTFTSADGLTSDQTRTLFEDREGNIWIGTELGLDIVHPADLSVETGIPANSPRGYHMTVSDKGVVYVAGSDGLYRIEPGKAPAFVMRITETLGGLCAGRDDTIWLTLSSRILRLNGKSIEDYPKPGAPTFYGCAEDRQGRLWLPAIDKGLFWREDGTWHRWPGLTETIGQPGDAARGPDGQAAILFRTAPEISGKPPFNPLYRERFGIGGLEGLLPGNGTLYVGGARGLARMSAAGIQTLDAARYPWLASINGLAQTRTGETWMIGDSGVVRMATAALNRAFDRPGMPIPHQLFDYRDGLNSFVQKSAGAQVAVGGDGRIWFLTRRNVMTIDPRAIHHNSVVPPVAIRAVTAGRSVYRDPANLRLPAGTDSVTIAYTALSLSMPSRVRFRYRLEGFQDDWVDPGTRREATFNGLRPGNYRFQVIAMNNDGVWNRTGASVAFSIPPTLMQTWPFLLGCATLVALLLWALYSLRLRYIAGQIRLQLEARIAERERIARELHDTLLQGVQGLILRFQVVADRIAEDDPTKQVINNALDRADQVFLEGRDRVRDLRAPDTRGLNAILAQLAAEHAFPASTQVTVSTTGIARPLVPYALAEIVGIVGEALFNAARHADARKLEIRIDYGRRQLVVSVQDDGRGATAERIARAASEGHYGIIGMKERADKMGGVLTFRSEPGEGTSVRISVPGAIAFLPRKDERSRARRWWQRLKEWQSAAPATEVVNP